MRIRIRKKRLSNKLYSLLDKSLRAQLDNLLTKDNIIYSLTLLKKEQLSFSTTEIKQTIDKQKSIVNLYEASKQIVKQLEISEQNIIYYSDLAQFYTIQKLRTFRSKNQSRLYLFCYVNHRLRKINDHLIASFIQKMLLYQKQGDEYQKNQIESVSATDKQLRNQAHKIMLVNVDDKIPDAQVRSKAFDIVPKTEYRRFLSELKKTTQANIIRKLSTTKTTSQTLKALIGLDEIIMTDYLLGYIDDKEQRSVVQRSLNRGESYHQKIFLGCN